ncbi:MAG: virulence factor SrfB [Rhodospirillales bacterium]
MEPHLGGLPSHISLVPQSGIQFVDVRFALDRLPRTPAPFWEEPMPAGQDAAKGLVSLRALRPDDGGELFDPVSGISPPPDEIYQIGRNQALETYANKWVPLPFFRVTAIAAGGKEVYDSGPTNWARVRIAELPAPDHDGNTHHLTLAFDTALRAREDGRPYTAIAPPDSERAAEFTLVAERDTISWFLNEPWMTQWLEELFRELRQVQRGGRPLRPEDFPHGCEHWARYIAFVGLLAEAKLLPRIKLVDVVSAAKAYEPISVDLVLDIGNSRTCGILIEDDRDARMNLNNSYVLRPRDLSAPERAYGEPFESRVEFVRASFGKDAVSRRSGRANAFQWLSPVRVGPEAVRLAAAARGNEGATGLSSPKRYLWDTRPISQVWRFNGVAADGVTSEPPVSGSFMSFVSEEGEVVRATRGRAQPAVRARFSRSSLTTFLLAELLLQALSQINAAETRYARSFPDVPRRLRRIMLTLPPAMALAEQRILRRRAEAAVKLAWDMLGWGTPGPNVPPEPRVIANLDEATATQLVFLFTEAAQKLKGDPGTFFALTGRVRDGYGAAPCLRIASIDIGGGTTDLMVATYAAEQGQEIVPRQNFREGFRIAGDEVLQEVIQAIVLPQIEAALKEAGARDAKAFLREILGGDRGSQSELERHLRRQLVALVLEPVGIAILHAYEEVTGRELGEVLRKTIRDVLAGRDANAPLRYVQNEAARVGARDFLLENVEIAATAARVDAVVHAALGPILADLCEVVHSFDCDWLLLSGRPSRLRAVNDIVLAKLPAPPHRIIGMHRYAVGGWYPFRDAAGRIDDPKTSAAVGATLCALAEGRLEGFLMRTSRLSMRSTARYLGRMELSGQILRRNVLLSNVDLEAKPAEGDVAFRMEFRAPVFLGFRQLDLERWPASRLYALEYANPDSVPKLKLPLTLTLTRADIAADDIDAEEKREDFRITEIVDADRDPLRQTEVQLRLQTEKSEAGYWRDTGALNVA